MAGAWVNQIFKAKAAKNGGIVRRQVASVQKHSSEAELKKEVKRRRFHMVRSGHQYVIICNTGQFKLIC